MHDQIVIDERYCGPPGSANGGYTAGRLAAFLDAQVVEVGLRAPVPVGRPLQVVTSSDGAVAYDGDEEIARAQAAELSLEVPPPVSLEEASEASTRFPYALDGHAFPACFGCGPERAEGDGLRIFAGPVAGREDVYAAPWTPHESLADGAGLVRSEFVWAALDCPGGCRVSNPRSTPPVVLARLTARLGRPVCADRTYVVIAWPLEREGRKREAGTALLSTDGEVAACARALWIELQT